MIPVGHMAKRISSAPDWLKAHRVSDVYSVSGCVSEDFADYVNFWRHNGYWLFDSPASIRKVAGEKSISLDGTKLFYYEAHESEFDGKIWKSYSSEPSIPTNVDPAKLKHLEGFDVVTFQAHNHPECSPLSCDGLAEDIQTNVHCLLESFDKAETKLNDGKLVKCEAGPYRIFAVYSVRLALTTDRQRRSRPQAFRTAL
jgi:hypothetical protein